MFTAKVAVCSEICTKYIDAIWALCRIIECWTWWYVKLPLGFKRLICFQTVLPIINQSLVSVTGDWLYTHVLVNFIVTAMHLQPGSMVWWILTLWTELVWWPVRPSVLKVIWDSEAPVGICYDMYARVHLQLSRIASSDLFPFISLQL
jgi:hypothetical protein